MSGGPDAQGDDDHETADDHVADSDVAPSADDEAADSAQSHDANSDTEETDVETLRRQVEQKYDFEDFGPNEMAEMSAEEWSVAFDPETWITGTELLDRVERDLKQRVADRDVFARIERHDGRLVAYSDTGYATVYEDGSVEGRGTVLRDVKPTVALCSMESYDVPENPPEESLPEPREVPEGSGDFGNRVLQALAGAQVLAGVVLVGAWLLISLRVVPPPGGSVRTLNVVAMLVAGIAFVAVGVLLFAVVANARLSDRFRAEEYRNRLRAVDLEPGERPDFLPDEEAPRDADRLGGGGKSASERDSLPEEGRGGGGGENEDSKAADDDGETGGRGR